MQLLKQLYVIVLCFQYIIKSASKLYLPLHYGGVRMSAIASQITILRIGYSTVYSDADQRKHQSFAPLAFVRGIPRVTGEFPAQRASNAENVSIWWRHHTNSFLAHQVLCTVIFHRLNHASFWQFLNRQHDTNSSTGLARSEATIKQHGLIVYYGNYRVVSRLP